MMQTLNFDYKLEKNKSCEINVYQPSGGNASPCVSIVIYLKQYLYKVTHSHLTVDIRLSYINFYKCI